MNRSGSGGRVAGILLACLLLSPAPSPPREAGDSAPPAAAPAPPLEESDPRSRNLQASLQTASGIILRMDLEDRRLEVLTGIGLALRVLRIHCDESTVFERAGKETRLASLKRGDPVRVSFRPIAQGYLASRIDLLPRPGTQGGPP